MASPVPAAAGLKRKREAPNKFYAVRTGHKPGIYYSYDDCLEQVKNHKGAQFKSFTSLTEAETFLRDGPSPNPRFTTKPQKYYAVRAGHQPGVYSNWAETQQQIQGFTKARHKAFSTKAQAQAFVDGDDNPEEAARSSKQEQSQQEKATNGKKNKKNSTSVVAPTADVSEIDENIPPGTGLMPPISEDGFDGRILLNPDKGDVEYKNDKQQNAMKMQPAGLAEGGWIKIYTDGSSLGNTQKGSYAGVGVYFGPQDPRNLSAPLPGPRQTNQRAELTAVQRAIDLCPRDRHIEIYTDSQYSISCLTDWFQSWRRNGWRTAAGKSVENRDLVESIVGKIEAREQLGARTKLKKVKGHSNDPGNVAADGLAVLGANEAKARGRAVGEDVENVADGGSVTS